MSLGTAIAADVAARVGVGLVCSVALGCLVLLSSEAFAELSWVVDRECGRSLVVCPDSPGDGSKNFRGVCAFVLNIDHGCLFLNGLLVTTFPLRSVTAFSDLIDCKGWFIGVVCLGEDEETGEICV